MSYRNFEIIENHLCSPFFIPQSPIFLSKQNDLLFSLLHFPNSLPSPTHLIHIHSTPFYTFSPSPELTHLSHRLSSLESKFHRLLQLKEMEPINEVDSKYTWTAEMKGREGENEYKWTAEIQRDDCNKGHTGDIKYQWSTEIKGGSHKRVYTWKATVGGANAGEDNNKKKENKTGMRIVEIQGPCDDHKTIVLRQAFAKRTSNDKGKKKELSPYDAAALIQLSFRNYLIRRSQSLRALRELAVAKTKLKELKAKFHNFSYRTCISRYAEERQKFSEKIIVLLLTVDAIEGVDLMVRAAKRSMVDELEAMLDVVDPQPGMRSLSMRRRTFDMPSGTIQKEIAEGVAQVVQMLDEENGTFEACL